MAGAKVPPLSRSGGYDVGGAQVYSSQGIALKQSEQEDLTCSKCKRILRNAKQVITCGCRYCADCIEQQTDKSQACVVDGIHYEKNEVRNDKGCQKEIASLEVDCPTKPDPCSWRGKLTAMEAHSAECLNRLLSCSQGCGGRYRRENLEKHMLSECPHRPSVCKHCSERFPMQTLQDHYQHCQLSPVKCEFCQKKLKTRKELHQHHSVCPEYQVSCPFKGCTFKSKKHMMNGHVVTSHIIEIAQKSIEAREEVNTLKSENQTLRSEVCDLTLRVDEFLQTNKNKDDDITKLRSEVDKWQLLKKSEEGDFAAVLKHQSADIVTADSATKRQSKKTVGVDEGAKSLAAATTGTDRSVAVARALNVQSESEIIGASQLQKVSESIVAIQNSLAQYGVAIEEIRLRQDVLDVKTTNGIFIWKIPDVRRRYRDAVERKTISLYSPPFYTSPHGYRVCVRTYLNGDGVGKGTHLSLFFFIMRSEHDNLLSWPFKQSVRFTLVHQKNPSLNITEAFVPDLNSPSFQKPEFDMNIASGFPKFARLSVLQDEGFTQDNVIYIKCQVDLSGLTPM